MRLHCIDTKNVVKYRFLGFTDKMFYATIKLYLKSDTIYIQFKEDVV